MTIKRHTNDEQLRIKGGKFIAVAVSGELRVYVIRGILSLWRVTSKKWDHWCCCSTVGTPDWDPYCFRQCNSDERQANLCYCLEMFSLGPRLEQRVSHCREDKPLHAPARGWIWSLIEETFPQGTDFLFWSMSKQGVNHYWSCVIYLSSLITFYFDGFFIAKKQQHHIVAVVKTGKGFEL